MKKIKLTSKKGFTLIELLVVIGILVVLAAIAIPSVAGLIDRANVSADNTNSNEMTNAVERFASEYELYCQDIASGKIKDATNLDSAQARVYNVTKALSRSDIEKLESEDGFNGRAIDKDTKYPVNAETARAIMQVYEKTSSSTFEPKQSDAHYYYSPDCGVVVAQDTAKSDVDSLNKLVSSGLSASGKTLDSDTVWIDLTTGEDAQAIQTTYYTVDEINSNEHLYGIGKTKPEYVVVEFNSDYTEAIITKNGDDSDGLIRDFAPWLGKSPLTLHATTLKKAIIKEGIFNTGNGCAGSYLFGECKNLTYVKLPNSLREISDGTFWFCVSLRNITIPDAVSRIGNLAFWGCYNLNAIKIPKSTTQIDNPICCEYAKSIYLHKNITKIHSDAFFASANTIIYCETPELRELVLTSTDASNMKVVVDSSKF